MCAGVEAGRGLGAGAAPTGAGRLLYRGWHTAIFLALQATYNLWCVFFLLFLFYFNFVSSFRIEKGPNTLWQGQLPVSVREGDRQPAPSGRGTQGTCRLPVSRDQQALREREHARTTAVRMGLWSRVPPFFKNNSLSM